MKNEIKTIEKLEETAKPVKSNKKAIEKKMQKLNDLYVNDFIDMDKYREKT